MESVSAMALVAFTSFFTLMNPIGTMPVFMSMTASLTPAQKKQTALKAVIVSFGTLLLFAFTGQLLFKFFGISVNSFRVVGGVIFFMMGYDMLQARLSKVKLKSSEAREYVTDISVTPLAIPMISGPGSITNSIVLMQDAENIQQKVTLIAVMAFVLFLTLIILVSSSRLSVKLGETGNKVLMRLMGLIVMVIAVEFLFSGLKPILIDIIRAADGA